MPKHAGSRNLPTHLVALMTLPVLAFAVPACGQQTADDRAAQAQAAGQALRGALRTYEGLNYTGFDLAALDAVQEVRIMPLAALGGLAPDGTAALTAAAA